MLQEAQLSLGYIADRKFALLQIQVVLEICSIVRQKLWGSRDLGHAHFQGKLFVRPLGIPDIKLHTKFEKI